jgi:hypothetical protein
MTAAAVKHEDLITSVIAEAELVTDPLDGLVERTRNDPGAPFVPEVLDQLAALKAEDPSAFESLRKRLRQAGCRVGELDRRIDGSASDSGKGNQRQVDVLLELAESAKLFHAADHGAYADVTVDGHRETHRVGGTSFRQWILREYFRATQSAPGSEALLSAISTIAARAVFDGGERTVHVRVGGYEGRTYLDLGDPTWRVVEIDAGGWRVIENPPVRFHRASGMKSLPIPVSGGSIDSLRRFLNVKSDADFVLVVACLLAWMRGCGPFPALVFVGEGGTAKTTAARFIRSLLDPNAAALRALPREERDLYIAANNGHVLAFDNVSNMPAWLSDAFCRIATGGGFAVRQHYKDQDEVLFEATRPILLTAIEDIVNRPDLIDRCVLVTLEPIDEDRRREERELQAEFEAERPRILGALLDAVATGLGMLPRTKLRRLPRMADFAMWATACESAFWSPGTFLAAYWDNRRDAMETAIEGDAVAAAIQKMMASRTERTAWTGTATDLLEILNDQVGEGIVKSKGWPANASALGGRLREIAPSLRSVGININVDNRKGKRRNRMIEISPMLSAAEPENAGLTLSALSAPSATGPEAAVRRQSALRVSGPHRKSGRVQGAPQTEVRHGERDAVRAAGGEGEVDTADAGPDLRAQLQ